MTRTTCTTLLLFSLLYCIVSTGNAAFVKNSYNENHRKIRSKDQQNTKLFESNKSNDFDFGARIESAKSGICGLLAGGFALAPFSAAHNLVIGGDNVVNGLAQWEFDTDMGSLEGALFAIVVRPLFLDSPPPLSILKI